MNTAVNLCSNQNRVEGLTQGLVRLGGKEKWQLAAPAADLLLLVRPGQGCCSYRPGRGCCSLLCYCCCSRLGLARLGFYLFIFFFFCCCSTILCRVRVSSAFGFVEITWEGNGAGDVFMKEGVTKVPKSL